jgi:hypothetical protein
MVTGARPNHTSGAQALPHAARVAKAGGTDAAFIAGQSTASWPSNSTNTAPMKA